MSTTRDRSGSSTGFGLQDFGALSELRAAPASAPTAPNVSAHLDTSHTASDTVSSGLRQAASAAALSSGHSLSTLAARHDLTVAHHAAGTVAAESAAHNTSYNPLAAHDIATAQALHEQSSTPAPVVDVSSASAFPAGPSIIPVQTSFGRNGGTDGQHGSGHGAESNGTSSGSHPPAIQVGGQLWFGVDDNGHTGLDHVDSDAAGHDTADHPTDGATFASVALDGASGLYFGYTRDGFLRDGHITNDVETGESSQIATTDMVFGTGGSADEVNAIAVDPINHIAFVGLFGQSDQYTGIIEVQYDPVTGALTNPYNAATGVVTDFNHMLFHDDNNGHVNGSGISATNIVAMQYDMQNSSLYYVDQSNGHSFNFGSGTIWNATNGIYVVGTSGSVGGGTAPTPTLLTLNSQFAAGDNNNYIEGLAINEAQGLIYFAVNNASNSTSKLFYISISGGTATQMSLPGGVNPFFVDDQGTGVNPLAFDPNLRQLYVSDNSNSQLVQLTLSADGHTFSSGNADFLTIDHSNPGTGPTGLFFDPLPTLSTLTATSTEAVQGSSAITLLTANPAITDPQDGASNKLHMGYMQIVVANAQSGDNLYYFNGTSNAQSGTFDGGKMTVSWNSTTHTLTLTGNETEAAYDTFFQNVLFQDLGTDNSSGSHPTRTIDWIISDGTTVVNQTTADSNEKATTVVIDRAPTVVADNYAVVESAVSAGTSGTGGTGVFHNDTDLDADAFVVTGIKNFNNVAGSVGSPLAGQYGSLTLNANGSYSYSANNTAAIDAAATGSHPVDTFTYTVSDGLGGVSTTTVSFTIDRAPTLVADSPSGQALEAGSPITGNVLTNDSDKDGDTITVSAVNGSTGNLNNSVAGTYGSITIHGDGSYSYSASNTVAIDAAATGSHLTDTFTYTADDAHGGTTTTTITVTIDRAPTVVADAPSSDAVESGSSVTGNVLTNDSDRDGDTLAVSAVAGSSGNLNNSIATTYGHVTIHADGSYSYSADNTSAIDAAATGSHLTDTVSYTASDGFGGTTTTNLVVTLDRGPTVVNDNYGTISEGGSTGLVNGASGVLFNDSDRDGDTLTVSAVGGSGSNVGSSFATTYGHITLNADGSYSYLADNTSAIDAAPNGAHPVDTVTFTVSDGFGGFTTETLSFTIDRAAAATADSLSTTENADAVNGSGGNANLLANDQDKDGDSFAITAVNGSGGNVGTQIVLASGALLTVNADGTYTYDPNHAFDYLAAGASGASDTTATDTFSYTITGGSTVTVTITINGVDSNDTLIGTSGNDVINAGIGDDIFYDDNGLQSGTDPHDTSLGNSGGTDIFNGGSGDDRFYMGANLTAADKIDGGTNSDTVSLNGDYSAGLVFNATTMVNVEFLQLANGHSYNLTMNDATVGAGQTLTIQAGSLGASHSVIFDGSAELDGKFHITTGAGNDTLTGGAGNDRFNSGAGNDTINGGGGNDKIVMNGFLTAADKVDGGSGTDSVILNGDYSAGVTFSATTMTNVEFLVLVAGHSYSLTTNDATVASGETLTLRAGNLGAGDAITFNGAAETNGNFVINAGDGSDSITTGGGDDIVRTGDGIDTVHAGGGNDTINVNAFLTASDTIDGGTGTDILYLDGDYSAGLTLTATTVTNIEQFTLADGNSYNFTTNDATVASGEVLTIKANALDSGDSLTFNGSAETNGSFDITAGAGNDVLIGGAGNDIIRAGNGTNTLTGGLGQDSLLGGSGADTFIYNAVADSTSVNYDIVHGFDTSNDTFFLTGITVNAIDSAVNAGHLSLAHFDTDLAAAIDGTHLFAHDAILFTASTGGLQGHTFLVVDVNGIAGYQAGQDLVIELDNAQNLGSLSAGNFGH